MQIHTVGNCGLVKDLGVVLEKDILPRMALFQGPSKMTYHLVKVWTELQVIIPHTLEWGPTSGGVCLDHLNTFALLQYILTELTIFMDIFFI